MTGHREFSVMGLHGLKGDSGHAYSENSEPDLIMEFSVWGFLKWGNKLNHTSLRLKAGSDSHFFFFKTVPYLGDLGGVLKHPVQATALWWWMRSTDHEILLFQLEKLSATGWIFLFCVLGPGSGPGQNESSQCENILSSCLHTLGMMRRRGKILGFQTLVTQGIAHKRQW